MQIHTRIGANIGAQTNTRALRHKRSSGLSHCEHGVGLVEVLVVVGILAVLIALILPAAPQAHDILEKQASGTRLTGLTESVRSIRSGGGTAQSISELSGF